MKKLLFALLISSSTAYADEFVQMSNGMTCWRDDSGYTYGCSGGVQTGDTGYNDVRTGERYETMNDGREAVDTRTGRVIYTPDYNN